MPSAYQVEDGEGENLHDLPAGLSDPQVSEIVWPTSQEVPPVAYGGTVTSWSPLHACQIVSFAIGQLSGLWTSLPSQRALPLQPKL